MSKLIYTVNDYPSFPMYEMDPATLVKTGFGSPAQLQSGTANASAMLMALSPDGHTLYCASPSDGVTVNVVNMATQQITGTRTLPRNDGRAAVTPDGLKLVACLNDGSVTVLDIASNTYNTLSHPGGIWISGGAPTVTKDGALALCPNASTNGTAAIAVVNIATCALVTTFRPGGAMIGAMSLALSPDGTILAVPDYWGSCVYLVKLSDYSVLATLAGNGIVNPGAAAWSKDGKLYVGENTLGGGVHVYDGATFAFITNIAGPQYITQMTASPDRSEVYATSNVNTGSIYVIATATETVATVDSGATNGAVPGFAVQPPQVPGTPVAPTGADISPTAQDWVAPALSANATSQDMYIAPDLAGSPNFAEATELAANVAAGATVHATGLTAGATYWVYMVANNVAGSTTGAAASLTETPAAPGQILPASVSGSQVNLPIPALSGGATQYDLWRATVTAGVVGAFALVEAAVAPGATYEDLTVAPGTSYQYLLHALDLGGFTIGAASVTITTGPAAPAAPTVSGYSVHDLLVDVPGALVSTATSYSLEVAPDVGGEAGTFATFETGLTAATASPIDVGGRFPGTAYWLRWRAYSAVGNSAGAAAQFTTENYVAQSKYFFSTGRITAHAMGDTPDGLLRAGGTELGAVQDLSMEQVFEKAELRGPTWLSDWPEDIALSDASLSLKVSWVKFWPDVLSVLIGAVLSALTDEQLATVEANGVRLPPFKLVIILQDVNGNQSRLTFFKVYAPKLTIAFKRKDFAMPNAELIAIEDENGNVWLQEWFAGAVPA